MDHNSNDCHPVHDSSETIEFAEYYHKAMSEEKPKQFSVTFRYLDKTDAALHEEILNATSEINAINLVLSNHNYQIEWHTVKELHF